jgi:hypothetical protein
MKNPAAGSSRPPGSLKPVKPGLKHAQHDGADKGESQIRGYNAQPADQWTDESHWEGSLVHVAAR